MDNTRFYKLVEEVRQQCRFVLLAYQNLRTSLQALDQDKTFLFAHSLLNHGFVLSRLFWPSRQESQARGERLRHELNIAEPSPLRIASFRAHLEQPDEKFEDWLRQLDSPNYVETNVMPTGTIAGYKPDRFLRSLDPESYRLDWSGESCDLKQLAEAARRLEGAANAWLRSHNPW